MYGYTETVPSATYPNTWSGNPKVPVLLFVNRTNNAYVQYRNGAALSSGFQRPAVAVVPMESNRLTRLRSSKYCKDSITSTSERIERAAI